MHKSIEKDLAALRDRLEPSPMEEIFAGLHHVAYRVAPGYGPAAVKEYALKTNYRLSQVGKQKKTGAIFYLLKLAHHPVGVIFIESAAALSGYPRLSGLGFKVSDLSATRQVLKFLQCPVNEAPMGLATGPIAGLSDTFTYVADAGFGWLDSDDFSPIKVDPDWLNIEPEQQVWLRQVGEIDHIAYRIRLAEVETAATQIMRLTAFRFNDCYSVDDQNAETMVFRWGDHKPALVASYGWDESSVVWKYTAKYGPRVHHCAFYTNNVLTVIDRQRAHNIQFTTADMIGSKDRGILQIFSVPSENTHEITEYIERFQDFRGFFDRRSVGELMGSTQKYN